ncbi:hypothetical protein GCM10023194_03040 [Planotetraspora phitsanulokensis]|uniref:Acyl-CoA carboxylase epsilon subunit-like protein n=1 Tax=Planotetraspora phitsanulokensis TaxID=575192 RepID=A0A8J3UDD6_9ACTN|nr:acyl-CoA carboxylase subunit epsilon [Planotetraspora phitsanulokensis]GII43423.1 hypothetical protein Pph01_84260 [Planotetraspora phitsanulokensis]
MSEPEPYLRIVRGDATTEEIAALVAALSLRTVAEAKAVPPVNNWRNPAHRMRRALSHGTGAWRAAFRPGHR